MSIRMQQRRGTASVWLANDPILAPGEIGIESDTNKFKVGNGIDEWSGLDYFSAGWESVSVSSNISLEPNINYLVDTSVPRTLSLPATPANGDEIHIFDATGTASSNNITVVPSGTEKIHGQSQNLVIDVDFAGVVLFYVGAAYGWRVN